MEMQVNTPNLRFAEFAGEWEKKKLGEVAEIYDGTHQTPNYVENGVKFVSVENINDIENTDKFITSEAFEKEYKIKPKFGDILMTRITAGIIGATAIVKNNEPLGFYVSLALIRIKHGDDVSFLCQRIASTEFKHELHKRIIHVAFPKKINLGDISDCEVNFPTLPEQQKIASFLTAVDDKLQALKKKKSLLDHYKKGVMQKIFSQELRFKDDDGNEFLEWEEKILGEIGDIVTGKTPSTSDLELWNGDIQFVTPTDINENKYQYKTQRTIKNLSKTKLLPSKSIMFTCIASIGKMSLSINPCVTNQQINSIVPYDEYDKEFIYYAILNIVDYIKSTQSTNTLPIINKTDFSKFEIKIPIDIKEQTKIANFLSAIDEKIQMVQGQIEKMEVWKKGLLQKMFV